MDIRPGTAEDWAAIDRVFRTSFCDTFAHLYRSEDLDLFLATFTPEAWRREFDDPRYAFQVAQAGNDILGYVKLGPVGLPVQPEREAIELKQFYLLKPFHGAGLAAPLMDWALGEARARGAHEMYLSVFTENHRARRFYQRYGFVDVRPYAFMVGNHADEDIIMKAAL